MPVLSRVNEYLHNLSSRRTMLTCCYVVLDRDRGTLRYSSAGHPPPVLALPGHPAVLLDVPSDHPVGVPGGLRRRVTTIDVAPGALLCFYTDGLVESRNTVLDVGLERLCASIAAGPVDSFCAEVMARRVGGDAPGDDVAILALRRQDSGEIGPLNLVVPALPWSLRDIRFAVRRWLSAVGAAPRAVGNLRGSVVLPEEASRRTGGANKNTMPSFPPLPPRR